MENQGRLLRGSDPGRDLEGRKMFIEGMIEGMVP